MPDKEKVIVEIMGLVSSYGSAVEATVLSEGHSREEHKEFRAYKLVESRLRELVKQTTLQQPLSNEEIDALWVFCGDLSIPQKVQRRMIVRTAEAAHGIIKGF